MTTIVALEHNSRIYMGADKRCSNGYRYRDNVEKIKKITVGNESILIGHSGLSVDFQIVESKLKLPRISYSGDPYTTFQDIVIPEFMALKDFERLSDRSVFLICFNGNIITLGGNLYFNNETIGFAAIGSGSEYALGSLFETQGEPPEKRIRKAMLCAAAFDINT